jgi:hypothetical protein
MYGGNDTVYAASFDLDVYDTWGNLSVYGGAGFMDINNVSATSITVSATSITVSATSITVSATVSATSITVSATVSATSTTASPELVFEKIADSIVYFVTGSYEGDEGDNTLFATGLGLWGSGVKMYGGNDTVYAASFDLDVYDTWGNLSVSATVSTTSITVSATVSATSITVSATVSATSTTASANDSAASTTDSNTSTIPPCRQF